VKGRGHEEVDREVKRAWGRPENGREIIVRGRKNRMGRPGRLMGGEGGGKGRKTKRRGRGSSRGGKREPKVVR